MLSVLALFSYPLLFVNWASTRDFPWANFLLFTISAAFGVMGLRRAFKPDRRKLSKVLAAILTTLTALIFAFFIFIAFIAAKWLPTSTGAPQVGQKAPNFSLTDTNGKSVSLAELLSEPIKGKAASANPKGVLLIFYRGYW